MRDRSTFRPGAVVALGVLWVASIGAGPRGGLTSADDLTFRPTVIVRKGLAQGTGTIIASKDGETLVLTAAHVVNGPGLIGVEVHRYNMGVEHSSHRGGWPVTVAARVAAKDDDADVAVVRIRGRPAFPFVARLAAPGDEPKSGAVVTSVGVDGGAKLESWTTTVRDVLWYAHVLQTPKAKTSRGATPRDGTGTPPKGRIEAPPVPDSGERPFLMTARAPEHGRSGGGLFLGGDRPSLVGVCVGRVELKTGAKAVGVFSSVESVRKLLREHNLEAEPADASLPKRPGRPTMRVTKPDPTQEE